jgi:hypothetical protein
MSQRSLSELAKSFLMLVVLDTLGRALLFGHFDNCLNTPNLTSLQPHLDAMWMTGGVCEDIFHNSTGELSGALILLLNNIDGIT